MKDRETKMVSVTVTTVTDVLVELLTEPLFGKLYNIIYEKVDFTNGVDFKIYIVGYGQIESLWVDSNVDASEVVAPRQVVHDAVGAGRVFIAAGEPISDHFLLCGQRILIQVTSGGTAKSGKFHIKMAP